MDAIEEKKLREAANAARSHLVVRAVEAPHDGTPRAFIRDLVPDLRPDGALEAFNQAPVLPSIHTPHVEVVAGADAGGGNTGGVSRGGAENPASILIHESISSAQSSGGSLVRTRARSERYAKAHARAAEMAQFLWKDAPCPDLHTMGFLNALGEKLASCGTFLVFRDYYLEEKNRLHAAAFCQQHLLCPLCAIRRGAKMIRRYVPKVATVLSGGGDLYLVTFTVKNGPSLWERFCHVRDSIQVMHDRRRKWLSQPTRRAKIEACKARGSVFSFEIKRGEGSGLWHPHVHAVWLCDEEPDETKLSDEWRDITRDSFQVNVKRFKCMEEVKAASTPEQLVAALGIDFIEVFKYALAFSFMPLEDNFEAAALLKGRHLVRSIGDLHGVEVDENLLDDPIDETDLAFIDIFATYAGDRYELSRTEPTRRPRAVESALASEELEQ